jgi:hypothetical protein
LEELVQQIETYLETAWPTLAQTSPTRLWILRARFSAWGVAPRPHPRSSHSTSVMLPTSPVLRSGVADPDPVPFLPLDPGSRMGKKSGSGSWIRIQNEQPGSYFRELRNHFLGLKYFIFDGENSDLGWKKSWIRDKNPGYATLVKSEREKNAVLSGTISWRSLGGLLKQPEFPTFLSLDDCTKRDEQRVTSRGETYFPACLVGLAGFWKTASHPSIVQM